MDQPNNISNISFTRRIWIWASVLLLFGIAAAAYYSFFPRSPDNKENNTLSVVMAEPQQAEKPTASIELMPASAVPPNIPLLDRPIIFSSVFSIGARAMMEKKIAASIAALKKDPRIFDEWMQLAILRKTVDDYEGAAEIWEFLTRMKPEQPGPYANLAALYTYELKNPALAEKNFILAIQKGPKELSVYRNAYDFYRYVQKDDLKAKEALQNGIKETQSSDLQYLLDHYSEL